MLFKIIIINNNENKWKKVAIKFNENLVCGGSLINNQWVGLNEDNILI